MKIQLLYLLLILGAYSACKHETNDAMMQKAPTIKPPAPIPVPPPAPSDPRNKYVGNYKGIYLEGWALVNTNSMGFLTGYEPPVLFNPVVVDVRIAKDTADPH